jgi:cytoskeletal protein CcmA (bactofilin family)
MWNKRREEEAPKPPTPPGARAAGPSAPAPIAPKPVEAKKESTPVSSTPMGRIEPESRGGSATIGKAVKIVGQIYSKEELYVDGDLEGTLEALEHKLTVGPNGTVHASVKAREVVVLGTIQGNVEAADKIEIRKDAKLVGDIRTARIIIEDGAYFKGSIDIVKAESKNAPKPQSAPSAAPSPAPAAAGAPGSPR